MSNQYQILENLVLKPILWLRPTFLTFRQNKCLKWCLVTIYRSRSGPIVFFWYLQPAYRHKLIYPHNFCRQLLFNDTWAENDNNCRIQVVDKTFVSKVRFLNAWTLTFFYKFDEQFSSGCPLIANHSLVRRSDINKLLATKMTAKPLACFKEPTLYYNVNALNTHLLPKKINFVWRKSVIQTANVVPDIWLKSWVNMVQRADDGSHRNFGWLARFSIGLLWICPYKYEYALMINPLTIVAPFKAGQYKT